MDKSLDAALAVLGEVSLAEELQLSSSSVLPPTAQLQLGSVQFSFGAVSYAWGPG